ncbi:WI12 domain-containing protein, partial [Cephalotus follicularis]
SHTINYKARMEIQEQENKRVVTALYEALINKDVNTVHSLLAPDIDWWFHGPPTHQHLMHILNGSSSSLKDSFIFIPQSVAAFESTVLVEGDNKEGSVSWVHAWTLSDGIIKQVKEYFNTGVTVTRFGVSEAVSQSPPLVVKSP